MNQHNDEKFLVFILSLSSLGLIIESYFLGWEFWVPPALAFGFLSLWAVHLYKNIGYVFRITYFVFYAGLMLYYHAMHKTSYSDVAIAFVLALSVFTIFNKAIILRAFLIEYFTINFFYILNLSGNLGIETDKLGISRLLLHVSIVCLVYFIDTRIVEDRLESSEREGQKDRQIDTYEADMEDFLSNISHELRTPVNVVNGMSDALIKRNVGYEVDAIKNAGIRLAYQIEDIQDYTECRRKKVLLEEDNYISTSLVNDVVAQFRVNENFRNLELVVDMDPKVPTMMCGDIKKLHKICRHLLENALKFTRRGGILFRLYSESTGYGVNLCIEVTDTGIGIDKKAMQEASTGMYQANKKRDRSSGGIGLGLTIVYGFAHAMDGAVKIESDRKRGTTVRVTLPQKVINSEPCIALSDTFDYSILFHVKSSKYKVPRLRDFYRNMAANLAHSLRTPLYSAETIEDVKRLKEKMNAGFIFMGQEEYEANSGYFDELSCGGTVVAVSANPGFKVDGKSKVIVMPKPLYAYPVVRILNGERNSFDCFDGNQAPKPMFTDVRALIVDDEPMNLIVATEVFKDYGMIIDTAGSGREAINKFKTEEYDVIFMDHMMPEMDGVEAMKQIRSVAGDSGKEIIIIALTANAVSGAREMFIREGFNGFVAKPINVADFERVMLRELPETMIQSGR